MPHPTHRRRGATLTDVLVIVGVVGLLVLIVVVLSPRRRHIRADKVKCGSNLRQIGQSMRQYALDHDGAFPRTRFDADAPTPRFFTGVTADDPFADNGPQTNDVTAAWWLLLRESDVTAEIFICPNVREAEPMTFEPGVGKRGYSNFAGQNNLSYSFANPYPSRQATADGFAWNDRLGSTFAVAGDLNPGGPAVLAVTVESDSETMKTANSPNHGREGQNLLFGDGSVRFVQSPFEGPHKDNVYTAGGPERPPEPTVSPPGIVPPKPPTGGVAVASPPLAGNDSVLLPTAYDSAATDAGYAAAYRSSAWKFVWWLMLPGFAVGAVLVVLMMLWANRARQRKLDRGELPDMPPRA